VVRRTTGARLALAVAGLMLVTTACGGSSSDSGAAPSSAPSLSGKITVFAASSLTKTFTALGKQFEAAHPGTTVVFSFEASSSLAQKIIAGAPADLFASASAKNMEQVTASGDASDPQTFASNVAEIAVAPRSKDKVRSLADLAKPGLKVALCQPEVPCGALAQKVLANAGVTVKPVTQGLDVKSTLAYVKAEEVDAAIVYVTDVKAAGATVVGVEVPAADNASTAYLIAPVKASGNTVVAAAFQALVLSPAGQDALAEAGFQGP
jgi:molybdate transport system substrate-binding protein